MTFIIGRHHDPNELLSHLGVDSFKQLMRLNS